MILSSVAQQEVESLSGNVSGSLQMKMKNGDMVGYCGSLGYNYDPDTKLMTINEKEAEIVKYIFDRYIYGRVGARTIARELEKKEYLTKTGNTRWHDSTVTGILENEKYYGALEQGKTITVNPITKKRLSNFGEGRKYCIEDHHEPIIDIQTFAMAEDVLRSRNRNSGKGIRNQQCSHKHVFSSLIECGFCQGGVSKRSHSGGTKNKKVVWHCTAAAKRGKKECPECKSMRESVIEEAFVESFNKMCSDNKALVDGFIKELREALDNEDDKKEIASIEKILDKLDKKVDKLLDMRLEELISKSDYLIKKESLVSEKVKLEEQLKALQLSSQDVLELENRVKELCVGFDVREPIKNFDERIFKEVVDKIIIGGKNNDGEDDPYLVKFVYKSGYNTTGISVGRSGKNLKKNTPSNNEDKNSSLYRADTCGVLLATD